MATKNRKPSKETSILIRLRDQAKNRNLRPRTQKSINFYIQAIKRLGKVNPQEFKRDRALITRQDFIPGRLMFYEYNAITKNLPYWDKYPMTLIMAIWKENGKTYFDGLNFHYLPPYLRYQLMIRLLEIRSNNRYDATTKLQMTYNLLSSTSKYSIFKGAYKRYLLTQVSSRFRQVELKYMEIAINLPLARWQKGASDAEVWQGTIDKGLGIKR